MELLVAAESVLIMALLVGIQLLWLDNIQLRRNTDSVADRASSPANAQAHLFEACGIAFDLKESFPFVELDVSGLARFVPPWARLGLTLILISLFVWKMPEFQHFIQAKTMEATLTQGRALLQAGYQDRARAKITESIELQKDLGASKSLIAETYITLAEIESGVSKFQESAAAANQALTLCYRSDMEGSVTAARAYLKGVSAYVGLERFPMARHYLDQAKQIIKSNRAATAHEAEEVQVCEASLYYRQHRYWDALDSALQVLAREAGKPAPVVSESHLSLSEIPEIDSSEPIVSDAHFEAAKALSRIAESIPGGDQRNTYNAKSANLFRLVISSDESRQAQHSYRYAAALANLAMVERELQQLPLSEQHLLEARKTTLSTLGPENRNYVLATQSLANLYLDNLNKLDLAEQYYKEALDVSQGTLGQNHSTTALVQHNLGRLYLKKGQIELARDFLTKALSTRKDLFGNDSIEFKDTKSILDTLPPAGNLPYGKHQTQDQS
ncbi:MAG: tetratricopeptide repeat protein [Candidatus Obscuribacterales bacterium]